MHVLNRIKIFPLANILLLYMEFWVFAGPFVVELFMNRWWNVAIESSGM